MIREGKKEENKENKYIFKFFLTLNIFCRFALARKPNNSTTKKKKKEKGIHLFQMSQFVLRLFILL